VCRPFGASDRLGDGRHRLVESVFGAYLVECIDEFPVDVTVLDLVDSGLWTVAENDLGDVPPGPSRPDHGRPVDDGLVNVVHVPATHRVDIGLSGNLRVESPAV
jgi:hypothetical protein